MVAEYTGTAIAPNGRRYEPGADELIEPFVDPPEVVRARGERVEGAVPTINDEGDVEWTAPTDGGGGGISIDGAYATVYWSAAIASDNNNHNLPAIEGELDFTDTDWATFAGEKVVLDIGVYSVSVDINWGTTSTTGGRSLTIQGGVSPLNVNGTAASLAPFPSDGRLTLSGIITVSADATEISVSAGQSSGSTQTVVASGRITKIG